MIDKLNKLNQLIEENTSAEVQRIFQAVLDTIPVRVFWKDINSNYLGCNAAFAKDSGYDSPDELIGKDDYQMSWKNEAEDYRKDDKDIISSGEPKLNFEEPQTWPNGTKLVLRTSKIPLKDKDGKIYGILGTYEDITEHKLAEETIKASEKKYSSLFKNMLNGFAYHKIVLDNAGRPVDYVFLEINDAFTELTGLKKKDTIGKSVKEVMPGIENSEFDWIAEYGKVALTGCELRTEQFAEPLNKWYSILAYSNKEGYFAAVFEDITERRYAEEELKKSEKRFKNLFSQSNDPIFIHDLEGKLTNANQMALDKFGYSIAEIQTMHIADLHPPETLELSNAKFKEIKKNGSICFETDFLTKNGETFPGEVSASIIETEGNTIIQGIVHDLTERNEAREAFNAIIKSVTGKTGTDFFKGVIDSLYDWLGADCVLIGTHRDDGRVEAIAMKMDGEYIDDYTYLLAGSPCEEVTHQGFCIYEEGVADKFPEDKDLIDMEAEGYIGVPLKNSKGEPLGVLAAISRRRLEPPSRLEDVLEILASRVAVEIEHKRSEDANIELGKILENSLNEIYIFDADTLKFVEVNRGALENIGYSMDELRAITPLDIKPDYTQASFEKVLEPLRAGLKEKITFETLHKRKDGSLYLAEVHLQKETFNNSPVFIAIILDITERKHAEKELFETTRRLRSLSSCNEAILRNTDEKKLLSEICRIIVETDGHLLAWVGYAEDDEEKTIRPVAQMGYHDGYLDSIKISWADNEYGSGPTGNAIRTKNPVICQNILTDPRYEPWRDEALKRGYGSSIALPLISDDNVLGTLNIYAKDPEAFNQSEVSLLIELTEELAHGITTLRERLEKKQTEKELRKLSTAVEQSPATVVITDLTGTIEYANPKFTEMTGYTIDEAIGQNPRILKTGHTTDKEYKELWETITSGKEWRGEFLNKKKNGDLFWEAASISPVKDEAGNITNFIAVKEDITEKKHSETIITQLGRILEDSLNEITIFDMETLRYLEANNGARNNMGYTMEELKDITPVDIKPHIEMDEFERIIEPLRSGKTKRIEFTSLHQRKDGSTYTADIHMQTTTFNDKPAFVSIILDETDRMQAEKEREKLQTELQQSQKMEAVGVLAAGVAHDFNNILTIIRLHTENAMLETGEDHPAYKNMKETLEASKSASNLTRQLLLFSRKQALNFEVCDLNITIAGLLKMLSRLIGEDIDVKTELNAALNPARLDKGGIEQVIMNLSVNARDAMAGGGAITIQTNNTAITEKDCANNPEMRPGDFICLSISDTGEGIPDEAIEHIFEPFYSTKGVGKGTGLGLSVVYGIIKQHKGFIKVTSKPNKGTTFDIYIPAEANNTPLSKEPEVAAKSENFSGSGKKILLVEDESGLRNITAEMLRANGFIVLEAENAKQAKMLFDREGGAFDLVLSDVIMPGESGIELVESLQNKKSEQKILLTSGYTDDKSQWPLIQERAYNFIQKPYSVGELLAAVKKALE